MSNPRKGSYGYTIRIDCGIDMNQFTDIRLFCSASAAGAGGFNLYKSASTLFVGQSTVYSSAEGLTFASGQWVYGQNLTAQAFASADNYTLWIEALGTAKHFKSPTTVIAVDP